MQEDKLQKSPIAEKEEKILKFWKENKIFEKTLEKTSPQGEFVFYDGPVTANSAPVLHTMEPFAFKDIIPRYKTMCGFHVPRKGGWDTHGLPVELQVEKKLGFKSKKDIEDYGIEAFNKLCRESVWEYVDLWKNFTNRMGYWADQEHPYVTYDNSYIEAIWNILKKVEGKKLLYKDYKVVPWCPRCGTALSSHELAQGYQDDKDLAVYAKFKIKNPEKIGLIGNVFLLAWTTTPWTLPGNVALAVGAGVDYLAMVKESEIIIASKHSWKQGVFGEFGNLALDKGLKGNDLVGLEYEQLYPYFQNNLPESEKEKLEKAYKVYEADFVNTEDGTGIVHTAVMYGQDDFVLGTKVGLPKFHLVSDDGHFKSEMDFLSGRFVKDEEVAVDIIKDLAYSGLLFKKEKYEHSYPHCWRCKTPLIYYARDSWYIQMSKLRDKLVKDNEGIHWEPEHIRDGRFGEWLKDVKDWAISRERYWGTPLPIWQNSSGAIKVIGSLDELKKYTKKSGNKYFVMRHGECLSNVKNMSSTTPGDEGDVLTEEGKEQVSRAAKSLNIKPDIIICSQFSRSKQTAEIVAESINFSADQIIPDQRAQEFCANFFDKPIIWHDLWKKYPNMQSRYEKEVEGESYSQVRKRMIELFSELEKKYSGKNILVISHELPLRILFSANLALNLDEEIDNLQNIYREVDNAAVAPFEFSSLPRDSSGQIDFHRPYIDEVLLVSENGEKMTRVKEVLDVWFDSGAMPFAQNSKNVAYPADYISEAIDQTRGWFYTLHAVGALMGKGKAFKNVICLGHILDSQGKKMSKSLGNIIDPVEMIINYGVDALRLWMYSVNQPGDSKNFDEKTVDEIVKKDFNLLENILVFYELYKDETVAPSNKSENILDGWIISRLNELISNGTKNLDKYKIFESARPIRDFINDFSTWYIRRSRDRFKSDDSKEKNKTLSTTQFVLLEFVKYTAPFMPFLSEEIYKRVDGKKESIHLEGWPEADKIDQKLIDEMEKVRIIVTKTLELRQKAGVKVRQPLGELRVKSNELRDEEELVELIKDEVNVKEVVFDENLAEEVWLDTKLTEELLEEGRVRDIIRSIQEWRKEKNLKPGEIVSYEVPEDQKDFFSKHAGEIKKATNIDF